MNFPYAERIAPNFMHGQFKGIEKGFDILKIIEKTYDWNGSFGTRTQTKYIILHHRAGNGDAESIHTNHVKNGWTGIGYHFYIRKDGLVYRGRPLTAAGAHCANSFKNYNFVSIGICFEGNFEYEKMSDLQLNSGNELLKYLKSLYPKAEIVGHNEMLNTVCPGKNFPISVMKNVLNKELISANDITWELNHSYFKIQDVEKFVKELDEAKTQNSSLYWGYYKLVNRKGDI